MCLLMCVMYGYYLTLPHYFLLDLICYVGAEIVVSGTLMVCSKDHCTKLGVERVNL
jgi:hypothetical protein